VSPDPHTLITSAHRSAIPAASLRACLVLFALLQIIPFLPRTMELDDGGSLTSGLANSLTCESCEARLTR
jgi:hypothetical protein